MPIEQCRVCGNPFYKEPLLYYKNMPRVAQFLPDAASLAGDHGIDLDIRQCSGCGLVQLSNEPVPYYRSVIRAAAVSKEMIAFRQRQFQDFVKEFGLRHKKIIEIGCGRGEYLSVLNRCGARSYGLEFEEESVAACVKTGLDVAQGFVQSPADRLPSAPFDAFFMLSFLEHLPDPNATLRAIYDQLSPDAVGLLEVPNFDMIVGKRLFSEFTADHLLYFTRETLTATLARNGFETIRCRQVWHRYILSAIVRKKRPMDLSSFARRQEDLKKSVEFFVSRFQKNKVCVWGAGHQALALISMLGLADKIAYVVDSAPFKQGKYTPATHLRIVSASALETEPVEAVIVMAASYSDEVADLIRKKFGRKLRLAIFRDERLQIV